MLRTNTVANAQIWHGWEISLPLFVARQQRRWIRRHRPSCFGWIPVPRQNRAIPICRRCWIIVTSWWRLIGCFGILVSQSRLRVKTNNDDTQNFYQAMNGPDSEGFYRAMCDEMETLEKLEPWDIIPDIEVPEGVNILDSTWVFKFKRKRYPDGSVRKLKARWCVRHQPMPAYQGVSRLALSPLMYLWTRS